MPELKDFRQTKKITLPNYKDSELEIYDSLLAGDTFEISKITDEWESNLLMLTRIIKDWNFTDNKNNKMAITIENLKLLKMEDLVSLIQELTNFSKKKVEPEN